MGSEFQVPITGSFTAAAQTKDLTSPNSGASVIQLTGTWVGTIVLEGSNDSSNWAILALLNNATKLYVASMTANGVYVGLTNGFQFLRLRTSAWTSGTAATNTYGSDAPSAISTDAIIRGNSDGTQIGNVSDSLKTNVTASALPTGAATAANQATEIASLASIDAGIPAALGQTTMSASMPVTIASDQTAVPISAAALPLPTGAATSANQTTEITSLQLIDDLPHAQNATLSKGVPVMGQLDDTGMTAATEDAAAVARITPQRAVHTNLRNQAGTEIGTAANPIRQDPTGTTAQPVTDNGGSLTVDTPQLAATLGQKTMANSAAIVIASDQSAVPISAAALPLPTGAATEATLAKLPVAQGSTTSGESGPLVQGAVTTAAPSYTNGQTDPLSLTPAGALRTDSSATTQPVSAASLPLPAGASTSALQTTGNSSLASIDAGIPAALGAATIANSMPVNIASDQTVPVSAAALPLPSGAATSANQTTEITSLQILDDVPTAMNGTFSKGSPAMGQLDDAATTAATEDNVAPVRITAQRALHTNLRDNSGAELGTIANPIRTGNADVAASGSITAQDTATTTFVGANSQNFYAGTPTANSAVAVALTSIGAVDIQVGLLGGGGTMVVEVSMDGGTFWFRPSTFQVGTTSYANSFASPFAVLVNVAGMTNVRVRAITAWAGTASVSIKETTNVHAVIITDSNLPIGASTAAAQATQIAAQATAANQATEIASLALLDDVPTAQNGAFVKGNPIMGQLDDTSTTAATEDNVAVARITAQRAIHTNLRDALGNEMKGQKTSANSIPVVLPTDQTITVTATPLPPSGSGFAFGQIATSATTTVPVEATTYTEQTTNAQRSIASASANDAAAGTGARTVTITYFDATMAGPFTETVTLNGTSFVNTVSTTICYIEKIIVATVGSTGSNVGILTLKAATAGGGATIGTVAATQNRTHWAHHYVATGKTCYISGFNNGTSGNSVGQGGLFVLRSATPTVANTPEIQISDFENVAGAVTNFTRLYNSPIQVAGPARVKAYVTPNATSAYSSYSSFDYIDN